MDFEAIAKSCPWRDCTACTAQIDLTPIPKRRKCTESNCAFWHWLNMSVRPLSMKTMLKAMDHKLMKVVNPKHIYGSVKISGPATDFVDFLCNQMREFERDAEAFVAEYFKELHKETGHDTDNNRHRSDRLPVEENLSEAEEKEEG